MNVRAFLPAVAIAIAVDVTACGGEKKLGESCEDTGKTDGECESGGVCGKNTSDALVCLKICADQASCPSTDECNGVEGSNLKACRPKSSSTGSVADGGKK